MVLKEVNENNLFVYLLLVDYFVVDISFVKFFGKYNIGNFFQFFILIMEDIIQIFVILLQIYVFFNNFFVIYMLEIFCRFSFKDSSVRVKWRDEFGGSFLRYFFEFLY